MPGLRLIAGTKNSRPVKGRESDTLADHLLHTIICSPVNAGHAAFPTCLPGIFSLQRFLTDPAGGHSAVRCTGSLQNCNLEVIFFCPYSHRTFTLPGSLWLSPAEYSLRHRFSVILYLFCSGMIILIKTQDCQASTVAELSKIIYNEYL